MNKLFCVAYIAGMTGMAMGYVGEMPKSPAEPYAWWLPLELFFFLLVPAVFGYLAGRDDC